MLGNLSVAVRTGGLLWIAGYLFTLLLRPGDAAWIRQRGIPVVVGLFVAGMVLPSIWLYWALIVAVIPAVSRTRAEAACIYVLTVLSSPALSLEVGIFGIYLLAFDKWLFAATGLAIAYFVKPALGPRPRGWFDWPLWCGISVEMLQFRGLNATSILRIETNVLVAIVAPYYFFTRSLRRPEDIRRVLLALGFMGFVLAVEAVNEARSRFLPYDMMQQHLHAFIQFSPYTKQRSGLIRASTSFIESTAFGLFLVSTLLSTLAIRDAFKAKRFWLAAMGMICIGLYMANARSALIGLGIGLVGYDIYRRRYTSMFVKLGLFAMLFAVALLVAQFSAKFADRLGVGSAGASQTLDYRTQLMHRGLEEMRKHPLVGVSRDQAYVNMGDLRQGEGIVDFVNSYIFAGVTLGFGGVIVLVMTFISMGARAMSNRRRIRREPRLLMMNGAIFSVAVTTFITCYTSGFGGRGAMTFYIFVGLGSALTAMRLPFAEQSRPKVPALDDQGEPARAGNAFG